MIILFDRTSTALALKLQGRNRAEISGWLKLVGAFESRFACSCGLQELFLRTMIVVGKK